VTDEKMLAKLRALLAKAEDEGCTPQEAEALTAKATELMAKYGIEQALLDAGKPEQRSTPTDKRVVIEDPYAGVKATLLYGIARAMGCQAIQVSGRDTVLHVFGYQSDLERAELLYTSLLLQMAHGLRRAEVPARAQRDYAGRSHMRAFNRSWMLGFVGAVVRRVEAAEGRAKQEAEQDTSKPGAALVLADRSLAVRSAFKSAYPKVVTRRVTYSGSGYGAGHSAGQRANIGGTGVGSRSAGAISR
jgi:hypothetical protein